MRYKLLGRSGLRVSELCMGTMTFGEDWGWGASKATSQKMFDMFAEAGGNFIDTANLYTNGTSEEYVGEFIKADRDHFVVATKYTLTPAANQGTRGEAPELYGQQSQEHGSGSGAQLEAAGRGRDRYFVRARLGLYDTGRGSDARDG